jgi:hypothetical protein
LNAAVSQNDIHSKFIVATALHNLAGVFGTDEFDCSARTKTMGIDEKVF